jgi:hypothetical protein
MKPIACLVLVMVVSGCASSSNSLPQGYNPTFADFCRGVLRIPAESPECIMRAAGVSLDDDGFPINPNPHPDQPVRVTTRF